MTYHTLVHLAGTVGPLDEGEQANKQLPRATRILNYLYLPLHIRLTGQTAIRRDILCKYLSTQGFNETRALS